MSAARFIMSVNNGVIEQTSLLAKRYMTPKVLPTEGSIRKSAGAFLRERELFVKGLDNEEILPVYDRDDLPIASNLIPGLQEKSNMIYSVYFNTDEPHVKIHDSSKIVYVDRLMEHPDCTKYLHMGFSWNEVVNILYKLKENPNWSLIAEAFTLLGEGQPLELILKNLDNVKAKYLSQGQKYNHGSLRFMTNHPGKLDLVTVKNTIDGSESLDRYAAINFNYLTAICKDDEEISKVLESCRCINQDGNPYTREVLFVTAMEILEKNKTWTEQDSDLLRSMKVGRIKNGYLEECIPNSYSDKIRKYLRRGLTVKEILDKIAVEQPKKLDFRA